MSTLMHSAPAVLAGIGAGLVMSAARAALRPLGLRPVLVMTDIWRGLLRLPGTRAAFGIHLAVSALVGLLYAFGFRILRVRPSPGWGVLGGMLHWLAASLFVAVVPALDREISGHQPRPGPFVLRLGLADAAAFLVNHLVYGVTMAALYARLRKNDRSTT